MAQDFMENSVKRAGVVKEELDGSQTLFSDYLRYHFPDNYPEDLVSTVSWLNMRIAILLESECASHERTFRSRITLGNKA